MKNATIHYSESLMLLVGVVMIFFFFVTPGAKRKPRPAGYDNPQTVQDAEKAPVKKPDPV